jgi:hypothetical protein
MARSMAQTAEGKPDYGFATTDNGTTWSAANAARGLWSCSPYTFAPLREINPMEEG